MNLIIIIILMEPGNLQKEEEETEEKMKEYTDHNESSLYFFSKIDKILDFNQRSKRAKQVLICRFKAKIMIKTIKTNKLVSFYRYMYTHISQSQKIRTELRKKILHLIKEKFINKM